MRSSRLPYLPGLDGLRALAVLAVILYHADLEWAPGGFLGVEIFFVISGYVITCLLLAERETSGRTRLPAFWARRARRLLPALYTLLLALLVYCALVLPEEISRLRAAAAAAFAYVTNWYLIVDQQSYFEAFGRPLLLRHLWSLAVEEQFYLVWPPLFLLLARLSKPRAASLVLLLAAASAALMAGLSLAGASADRMYYGTDTRAAGFLLGCGFAFLWRPFLRPALGRWQGAALDLAAAGALAGLVACLLLLTDGDRLLYRGGLAGVALLTAIAIAGAVRPNGGPARLLGLWPLRETGLRSYSLYLWHWPIVALTRPGTDIALDGVALLALRLTLTFLLAELSYRCVERPMRDGSFARRAAALWRSFGLRRPAWTLAGFMTLVGLATGAAVLIAGARPGVNPYTTVSSVRIISPAFGEANASAPAPAATETAPAALPPEATDEPLAVSEEAEPEPETATPEPEPTPAPPPPPLPPLNPVVVPAAVTAVGDSVMLGAAYSLAAYVPGLDLDATVGRQPSEVARLLWNERLAGRLGQTVLIHVGNNGPLTAAQFDEIMGTVADVPRVVFVNVRVPRSWQDSTNAVLTQGVSEWPNARLVDWHAASADRQDYFWDEGVHLNSRGAAVYVSLITQALSGP